jgi:phage terminase large subunit GpA-like protein
MSDAEFVDRVWRAGLAGDPQQTVSEWAQKYRVLPPTAAEPGRWRNSRTPFLVEIMDALSVASPIERVVVQKSAQCGGTEVGLNLCGSIIHLTPALTLVVMPTTESARRNVRTRVDPLIEAVPELRSRVVTPGPRKAGNSASFKAFPGGALAVGGADSAAGRRSTPARLLILAEVRPRRASLSSTRSMPSRSMPPAKAIRSASPSRAPSRSKAAGKF